MIAPPLLLWLRVGSREHPGISWPLPLFLVWLLLLPLLILALVLTIVADVVLFLVGERYHHYTLLLIRCCQLLAETRGTVVRVNGDATIVDLTID